MLARSSEMAVGYVLQNGALGSAIIPCTDILGRVNGGAVERKGWHPSERLPNEPVSALPVMDAAWCPVRRTTSA